MLYEIETATGVTPKALLDAPNLHGTAKELTNAYLTLSKGRSVGFAANPIPLSEQLAYIQLFGMPSIPVDIFVHLIGVMDNKYLELSSKSNGNKPTS